jgi:hypothetical protein
MRMIFNDPVGLFCCALAISAMIGSFLTQPSKGERLRVAPIPRNKLAKRSRVSGINHSEE